MDTFYYCLTLGALKTVIHYNGEQISNKTLWRKTDRF